MPTENQKKIIPDDMHRLIQDVLSNLGWSADAAVVAEGVHRLNIGLSAEDEFSVVCAWLGKCQLLHKLDQQQVPITSKQHFQVPDLLAKFSTQNTSTPLLIEVKSKKSNTLSFKPDYLQRLKNYAEMLGLPLLIAWKFHSLWMLFEIRHMRKAKNNFNISLDTAMRESLLCTLAGDVAYSIGAGAGLHIRFRKNKLVNEKVIKEYHTEQDWLMTVDDVAFTDYEGNRRIDLDSEVQSLFTAWNLKQQEEHTETHIQLRYLPNEGDIQFAHNSLVHLLSWESPKDPNPHWRSLLRKEQVTANVANFSAALDAAFRQKIVSHIFHMMPHTMPNFLPLQPLSETIT